MRVTDTIRTRLLCHVGITRGYPVTTHHYRGQVFESARPASSSQVVRNEFDCDTCGERLTYEVLSVSATRWWRRIWVLSSIASFTVAALGLYGIGATMAGYQPGDSTAGALFGVLVFIVGITVGGVLVAIARNDQGIRGPGAVFAFFRTGHRLNEGHY